MFFASQEFVDSSVAQKIRHTQRTSPRGQPQRTPTAGGAERPRTASRQQAARRVWTEGWLHNNEDEQHGRGRGERRWKGLEKGQAAVGGRTTIARGHERSPDTHGRGGWTGGTIHSTPGLERPGLRRMMSKAQGRGASRRLNEGATKGGGTCIVNEEKPGTRD